MKIKNIPVQRYSEKDEKLLSFLGEKTKIKDVFIALIEEEYSCECGYCKRIRYLDNICPKCKSKVKYRKIIIYLDSYKKSNIEKEIKENALL